jgi:hypothetical protein
MSHPLHQNIRHALFLAPEALIGPHFEACIRVADILSSQGIEITFLGCFDQDQRCVFQDSSPSHERFSSRVEQHACLICVSHFSSVIASRGYGVISPEALGISDLQELHCDLAKKVRIEGLGARTDQLSYGALAGASLLLIKKISLESPLSSDDLNYLEDMAFTVLQRHAFVQRSIEATNADVFLVFGQYAQNMAGVIAARSAGILSMIIDQPLNGDIDRNRIMVRKQVALTNGLNLQSTWKQQSHNLSLKELSTLIAGQKATMQGGSSWSYSPPISGKINSANRFGGRKRIVAFTSSLDEIDCSSLLSIALGEDGHTRIKSIYPSQIAWIDDLQLLAANNSKLDIVVRIHPREGTDPRSGGVASRHLRQLIEQSTQWKNIQIIWPQDTTSSYDLMMDADAVTTSWSNISIEAAILGIPVISPWYSNPTFPSNSFIDTPISREVYLNSLINTNSISNIRPMDRIKLALDFLAFSKFKLSLPLHYENTSQKIHTSLRGPTRLWYINKFQNQNSFNERFIHDFFELSEGRFVNQDYDSFSIAEASSNDCIEAILLLLKSLQVNNDSLLIRRLTSDLNS